MTLDEIKKIAVPACKRFNVRRLDLFGSLSRGKGNPLSDLDLLVEFDNPDEKPSKRFFGLLHQLEDNFQCQVDLLTVNGLRNPYFRRSVLKDRINLYEGRSLKYLNSLQHEKGKKPC